MTSSRNSTVVRVTGLATTQPDDALAVVLKAAIHGNLLEEERSAIQGVTVESIETQLSASTILDWF